VEDNFSKGKLDVIVSTSSLELGIDWDHVDQVILIGTPKNINRLIQRTGRSNHNHQGIAKSFLIPTNQFEYLECISAKKLAEDMKFESLPRRTGAKDVLCQHLLLLACGKGFCPKNTYSEVIKASPYRSLPFDEYIKILEFIKNGGYVLNNYKRWNKIYLTPNGLYKINSLTNRIKTLVNIGTIIDNTNIKIVLNTGKTLGYVDESFLTTLKKGDYFIFSGLNLICLQISSEIILVKKINKKINKTPIYWGGNLPLSENLSNEIFKNLHNISNLPDEIKRFIKHQKSLSTLPKKNEILIEKFPYGEGIYLCFYTFLGRQTNHSFCLFFIEFLKKKKY
jgi:ATP-dependent Lhr-like helicase